LSHTGFQFFQLYYEFSILEGGGVAERIVIFDTDYLLDKNYIYFGTEQ